MVAKPTKQSVFFRIYSRVALHESRSFKEEILTSSVRPSAGLYQAAKTMDDDTVSSEKYVVQSNTDYCTTKPWLKLRQILHRLTNRVRDSLA